VLVMLDKIQKCFEVKSVLFTKHAAFEMENEDLGEIFTRDVYEAVSSAELLREYPEDTPLPSCLLFGWTRNRRPIHVVCGYDAALSRAIVITVYEPLPSIWREHRERNEL
jgi:hypothetical protein